MTTMKFLLGEELGRIQEKKNQLVLKTIFLQQLISLLIIFNSIRNKKQLTL